MDAVSLWHLVVVWNDDHVVMAAMAYQLSIIFEIQFTHVVNVGKDFHPS